MLQQAPLSLYVHIPWCVQKCPYCDFNSHSLKSDLPEADYIEQLIADLDADLTRFGMAENQRALHSVFIGGGTPSLFSGDSIRALIDAIKARFIVASDIEITLEANPGTVEASKFIDFANAGVSRLSIGIQSFEGEKLLKLGRIHDSKQALMAAKLAAECGVNSFNIDLMHGLPNQTIEGALSDLRQAIALNPQHLSWYQLTIEPNTAFASKPPNLPEDDTLWQIQEQGFALLKAAGYQQYEVSAFAKTDYQSQHNKNYWQYGDYLGIGCGAHGKITDIKNGKIYRTVKVKHPKGYLDSSREKLDQLSTVDVEDLPFEYMMNRLRLFKPFKLEDFERTTGSNSKVLMPALDKGQSLGLLTFENNEYKVTTQGKRYLNSLMELFL